MLLKQKKSNWFEIFVVSAKKILCCKWENVRKPTCPRNLSRFSETYLSNFSNQHFSIFPIKFTERCFCKNGLKRFFKMITSILTLPLNPSESRSCNSLNILWKWPPIFLRSIHSANICWSSSRLEDVFKTCLEDVFKTCLEDVFKTWWRPTNVCWVDATQKNRRSFP